MTSEHNLVLRKSRTRSRSRLLISMDLLEVGRETEGVLSQIALWDCFQGQIRTQLRAKLRNSQ